MRAELLLGVAMATACAPIDGSGEVEGDFESPEPEGGLDEGKADGSGVVGDYVRGYCSTAVVLGLSRQIADEIECMAPGTLMPFWEGNGITFTGPAVLPYLEPEARRALVQAASARPIRLNSAFRALPQQFLLYRWWQQGRCGIQKAAAPGRSNHETGRALDVSNWSSLVGHLGRNGWGHTVPGDPVHFDHLESADLRGLDVHAFQRLWNRNHPEDRIPESGDYDPETAARLVKAPAGGFAIGACRRVDNGDWQGFAKSPGWRTSTDVDHFYGDDYLVIDAPNQGWAAWRFGLPRYGRYEVWVDYAPGENRNSQAVYRLRTSEDADPILFPIDQRAPGPVSLGVFELEPTAWLSVSSETADGATIADLATCVPKGTD